MIDHVSIVGAVKRPLSQRLKRWAPITMAIPLAIALMSSDHRDGPNGTADRPADIADLYAWHDSTAGTLTIALTFAGLGAPGQAATFDPNVLYAVHIDRATNASSFDQVADVDLYVRFARNDRGEYGVQVENMPGASGAMSGKVETVIADSGGRQVFAGLRDDPFFFDLDGFKATLAKDAGDSVLRFSNTHDTFAGTNITAVVMQMQLADVTVAGTKPSLALWASSGRKPTANAQHQTTPMQPTVARK